MKPKTVDGFKKKKFIAVPSHIFERPIYKEPARLERWPMGTMKVLLKNDVELRTLFKVVSYPKGVCEIPSDLAKLLIRCQSATPIKG